MELNYFNHIEKEEKLTEYANRIAFDDKQKEKVDRFVRRYLVDNNSGTSHIPFRVEIKIKEDNEKFSPVATFDDGVYTITGVDKKLAEELSSFVVSLNYPCDYIQKTPSKQRGNN